MTIGKQIKLARKGQIRALCSASGCPLVAKKGKQYCTIHLGEAKTDKYGFVVWKHTPKR